MSGLVDFERTTTLPDVPMEDESGVISTSWSPGFLCGNVALVLGFADADAIEKDS